MRILALTVLWTTLAGVTFAGVSFTPFRPLEDIVDAAFARHWKYGFSEKTSLLHGCPTNAVKPLSEFKNGIFDWYKGIPGGYGRGMGDCALNHGVALSGCVDRWIALSKRGLSPDSPDMVQTAEWAAKLAQGLLNLVSRHPYRGFVARGLCWEDGKSICSLSSIDQHTHWIHGLWRYSHSPMARREIADEYRRRVVEVAERMERTVTPERDYNFGLCDGRPDPRGICKMWWGGEPRPACCRLASIYAAAFDATGDPHWKEAYERIADVACAGAATITDAKATDPSWIYRCPTYCLLQNNSACETLLGIERDPRRRELLLTSMRKAAAEADWRTKEKLKNPKRDWYGMCAPGEMALAQLMTPGWDFDATAHDVLDGAIRNRKGWPTFAVTHFFAACWRLAARRASDMPLKMAYDNDDLYVEMTFLKTLADYGLDVSPRQRGVLATLVENPKAAVWHNLRITANNGTL